MLPLVSAILADSYWDDRYCTIAVSSLLYVLGMVALTTWALLRTRMRRSTLFFPLYLMSIGQGGYQPSLQAFGADQLSIGDDDDDDTEPSATPEEKAKVKSMFFQWWYFGMCSGSLLGNSTMSYVQDNFGWGLGFAIPSAVMAISVAAFFCCTPLYKQQTQAKGSGNKPSPNSVFKVLGAFLITALEMATARPGNARGWFSDDPREARLDNFYWFLALLCFISFVIFTHLCKYYNGKSASGR